MHKIGMHAVIAADTKSENIYLGSSMNKRKKKSLIYLITLVLLPDLRICK